MEKLWLVLVGWLLGVASASAYYEDFENPGNLAGTLVNNASVSDGYLKVSGANSINSV